MGWWGHDILSGDGPLDLLGSFAETFGLDSDQLDIYPSGTLGDAAVRARIVAWFAGREHTTVADAVRTAAGWRTDAELAATAAGPDGGHPDAELIEVLRHSQNVEATLAWQVLAVIAMAAGATLDPETMTRMADAGCDDEWAQDSLPRRAAIDRYLATLRDYDAAPTALASATIGDAFERAAAVGHTGLLNVDPELR